MTPREFWMTLFIVIGVEYWILQLSYRFKAEQDVINYISFAATISSLILATLAIIYGFLQSATQKKSSDTIELQIEELRKVQSSITMTTKSLDEQRVEISATADRLSLLSELMKGTNQQVAEMAAKQDKYQESLKKSLQGKTQTQYDDKAEPPVVLLRRTSFQYDVIGYALWRAYNLSGDRIYLWRFVKLLSNKMGEKKLFSYGPSDWHTTCANLLFTLRSFGFVGLSPDKDDASNSVLTISVENLKKLELMAIETKNSASETGSLKLALEIVDGLEKEDFILGEQL